MIFSPALQPATLIRRYKRFLADMILPSGEQVTVHCPNTGSMRQCMLEGGECWLSYSDNPKRKYAYTWQLSTVPTGHLACINTHMANKVVAEALLADAIPELAGYEDIKPEQRYGDGSRIDFLLSTPAQPYCYVEVKTVTLLDQIDMAQPPQGCFPDAKSVRAHKHIGELIAMKEQGQRAVLLFCAMHQGISSVCAAHHIDPVYADLLSQAREKGVELLAYNVAISPNSLLLNKRLPVL